MDCRIVIYGNADKSERGFPTPEDLIQFIRRDLFEKQNGRYRYTQVKNADVIVMSRDGLAYGDLEVESKVKPTPADLMAYPKAKAVYLITRSTVYSSPVQLADLITPNLHFGQTVTEAEFEQIRLVAGNLEFRTLTLATEELSPNKTYREGAVVKILVNAYERNYAARDKCIEHYGITCAVCHYSMADLYGAAGNRIIHVHHLREISSIGKEYEVNPIEDLRPVCPNCHAVLHSTSPVMSIQELQQIVHGRPGIHWPKQN